MSTNSLLSTLNLIRTSARFRASYYQERRFPPPFVRRFLLRYPKAPLYAVFGLCTAAMIGPFIESMFQYLTMSPGEFSKYREERTALVRERQKYGKNLWIPFFSSGNPSPTETSS